MSYKYIDIRPNPVTGIGSYQRGFSIKDFVDLPQVEHRRIGGPYKATFRIYADDRNMAEDLLFLGVGREVNIYNDKGIVDFGGMIYVVTLSTGGSKVRSSLLDMSNRVWARWQEAGTANPPDRSTVYNNTASQALYGIKEEVWNAGQQVSVAEASQYAEKQLQEYAWPTPRAVEISPGKKLADRPMLEITCFGWWHTLSHIRYNQTAVAGSISASSLVQQVVGTFTIIPPSLKTNLVSWWTLDEVSTGVGPIVRVDSHGANDLTDNGTTPSGVGKVSLATQHTNAVPDWLSHVSNADLQTGDIDFTFAKWVYLDNKITTQTFVSKDDAIPGGDREYQIHYNQPTDRFRMQVFSAVDVAITVVANTLGAPAVATWYFVVGWHDATANTLNIQVNDGGIDSIATGGALQAAGAAEFQIGARDTAAAGNELDGRVDEVSFWKRILTAAEKTAIYNDSDGVGYGDIGKTIRTGGIGQFIRSTDIRANGTLIEQTIDADMGGDAIIKSVVDMGDSGLNTWVAGVDHTREFYYRPGELGE